jgi:hypothetical protein
MTGYTVGTRLWFVPIRYWENQVPETGMVLRHEDIDGDNGKDDPTDPYIYVHHDGYGHAVYMRRADAFISEDLAISEAHRRKAEKEAKDKADFDAWWERVKL